MNFKMVLWFAGMWFVSGFVYSFCGMQIYITKNCALKLYTLLSSNTENWYAEACKKYWKRVIRKNRIILFILAVLVIRFVPLIGTVGYFLGYIWKMFFYRPATGPIEGNLKDSAQMFRRFAKPGCEEAFESEIQKACYVLANDPLLSKV